MAFGSRDNVALRLKFELERQVKLLEHGAYTVMAGAGHKKALRDVPRLTAQHGGGPSDWQKIASTEANYVDPPTGETYHVHAYLRLSDHKIFEPKIQPVDEGLRPAKRGR